MSAPSHVARGLTSSSASGPADPEPSHVAWLRYRDDPTNFAVPHASPSSPQEIRENGFAKIVRSNEAVHLMQDETIRGPHGDIALRIYAPENNRAEPLPVLMFFHGGIWYLNSLDTHDAFLRRFTNEGARAGRGFVVIAVDYRLAPEHKFPGGLEDCYTATVWAAAHAHRFGGDPMRLAVAGDSCGGNLAVAVALLARERGGPCLSHMLLLYPMTDHYDPGTPSLDHYAIGLGFTKVLNKLGWDIYGASEPPHGTPQHPNVLAAINRHPDLSGLPPSTFILAECDIVYDEGLKLAERLQGAGCEVQVLHHPRALHGFVTNCVMAELSGFTPRLDSGFQALADAVNALNRVWP